jgi:hypothetical protein
VTQVRETARRAQLIHTPRSTDTHTPRSTDQTLPTAPPPMFPQRRAVLGLLPLFLVWKT